MSDEKKGTLIRFSEFIDQYRPKKGKGATEFMQTLANKTHISVQHLYRLAKKPSIYIFRSESEDNFSVMEKKDK